MPCLVPKEEDRNAKNGMMTKVWGPTGWLFLHCVTFGYPLNPEVYDKDNNYTIGSTRENYRNFFKEVGNILPCKYCRDSYKDFYNEEPVIHHLDSRDALVKWFWNMHNKVNKKLGVKYCDSSLNEVNSKYESYRAKCKALSKNEIKSNSEKGCVTPADGTPKKCLIEIIKTNKGDITRRDNNNSNREDESDKHSSYSVNNSYDDSIQKQLTHFVHGFVSGLLVCFLLYIVFYPLITKFS